MKIKAEIITMALYLLPVFIFLGTFSYFGDQINKETSAAHYERVDDCSALENVSQSLIPGRCISHFK